MPIKARLMDQGAISGIGNLLADEVLWRARMSPWRPASSLSVDELDALRRVIRATVRDAVRNGGVHTGKFMPSRVRGGTCPRDGGPLRLDTVGGRTTLWCPVCQLG
jgi:formamidopyrimidine-DNA glycosylase